MDGLLAVVSLVLGPALIALAIATLGELRRYIATRRTMMLRRLIRGGCTLIAASALLASPAAAAAPRPAHFDPPKRYYDPDVGQFSFADPLFSALNNAESTAAATVGARFANPFPVFNPHGDEAAETTAICTLTLVCTQHDSHPSDAGYRALADLVWSASGYHRLR